LVGITGGLGHKLSLGLKSVGTTEKKIYPNNSVKQQQCMKILLIQHVHPKKRTRTNQKISIKKKRNNKTKKLYPKNHKI
jgi:hypothetical protein